MAELAHVQHFIELMAKTRSLTDLEALLENMTLDMGFQYFALVQHVDVRKSNNRQTIWLENYPDSWAEVFIESGLYANDPIHVASQHTSVGFAWSDVNRLIRLNAHHKRVLDKAQKEGMGDGFTVPLHIPGEANGTCSFGVKRGHQLPRHNLMVAQLIGAYAFEAARKRVTEMSHGGSEKPKLTPRQLDCLVHVSRGKSDWEIATMLGIKESTVRSYVDDACERYGVRRRVQLVVRALHDGHMTLRDAIG
ncbi:MAG: LuxR family transcriptional regulator [Sphingobium sp.]